MTKFDTVASQPPWSSSSATHNLKSEAQVDLNRHSGTLKTGTLMPPSSNRTPAKTTAGNSPRSTKEIFAASSWNF
ncbi:hypothetical protein HanIR_Chr13g0666671 [Helianthus annuus]|nr:hypothetical protein HanIR_Chr13g0666671 [Helianthus annuus]